MIGIDAAGAPGIERAVGPFEVVATVGGGSIGRVLRIRADGADYLLKTHHSGGEMFRREAEGLEALRAATTELRVPRVVGVAAPDEQAGWIVLEWIETGGPAERGSAALGRALAGLHRSTAQPGAWGWPCDNFIGPLPQENAPTARWSAFWAERRLEPRLRAAIDAGMRPGSAGDWDRLFASLDSVLAPAEDEGASLLHGDLWDGNVLREPDGRSVLIDPAVYRGHREADLAMMRLFGGFGRAVFEAYGEAWPIREGFERRCAVYQLYYLLVHVNLFGAGYLSRTAATLRRAVER